MYLFLVYCGFYSLQTQTSNILVWEYWLRWYITCPTIFSYLHEQGHLHRIAIDSLGKESTSGNGSVPYVSSLLMAFYLKRPCDTIYFTFLLKRRLSLFLVLLPVLTLAEEQTIPDSILQSCSTSAASFVPVERNLYITVPPEAVLAPGQCCSACLRAHTEWPSQPSRRVRGWDLLFLTPWAAFSCASTGTIMSTAWKRKGITDWAPWTGSTRACQTRISASRQHSVGMQSPWDGEASVCDRYWLSLLNQAENPAPRVLCISAVRVRPAETSWKSCSEMGSKTWLWLTLDNETGDSTVWVCFPAAAIG